MNSKQENEIVEIVDEIADELDPPRIRDEAERLGISVSDLLSRIMVEVNTRLS